MKKIRIPLLVKVLIAIGLGIGCSHFFPVPLTRVFVTFNDIFGEFLSFVIPILILALVAPGIADLGGKAGKLLGITALIAYVFTLFSGFLGYFSGRMLFPSFLSQDKAVYVALDNSDALQSYFHIEMPPVMDVMSALVLSFILGIGLSRIKGGQFVGVLKELRDVITLVIDKVLIPLIPLFIFGIFLKMGAEGQLGMILGKFIIIISIIFLMSVILLLIQFSIAGAASGKNPFKCLWRMLPAYLTALGTQSSAATIPVTLAQAKKNGISDDVADFVIPLCATIHLSGSCLKITMCSLAICMFSGMPSGVDVFAGFICLLGITMVAAPGVPGGAIMAALGVLSSVLGFDESLQGVMIALYITMDSFGTATNVTGDGSIALIIDKISSRHRS